MFERLFGLALAQKAKPQCRIVVISSRAPCQPSARSAPSPHQGALPMEPPGRETVHLWPLRAMMPPVQLSETVACMEHEGSSTGTVRCTSPLMMSPGYHMACMRPTLCSGYCEWPACDTHQVHSAVGEPPATEKDKEGISTTSGCSEPSLCVRVARWPACTHWRVDGASVVVVGPYESRQADWLTEARAAGDGCRGADKQN